MTPPPSAGTGPGQPRPARIVIVAGTGTEVGKTWLSTRLLGQWRRSGLAVATRKPAQSFTDDDPSPRDADLLAAATGEDPDDVTPRHRTYPVAMAPPMAADVLGLPRPTLAELRAELTWPTEVDIGVVETAGGLRSPIADDADCLDYGLAIGADEWVVVADACLGVLHAVRAATAPLVEDRRRVRIFLNRHDPADDLHRRNLEWLGADGFEVHTDPAALAAAIQPAAA